MLTFNVKFPADTYCFIDHNSIASPGNCPDKWIATPPLLFNLCQYWINKEKSSHRSLNSAKIFIHDEVLNCYRITGNENIVMEVVLKNQNHLETFIDQLITYGETKTQIVLSHVVSNKVIKILHQ